MSQDDLNRVVVQEGSATAKVIADSCFNGSRLVSVEVEFPRPYLAEFNTHRVFTRNSASSRAIPVWKRLIAVFKRPYVPNSFGVNKSGMQAGVELDLTDQQRVVENWLIGRDVAALQAYYLVGGKDQILKDSKNKPEAIEICDFLDDFISLKYPDVFDHLSLLDQGLHKQHANRPLELYSFHTVIVTSTYWRNFFGLRPSKHAQPEAQDFGIAIARAIMKSQPRTLSSEESHLPYIFPQDYAEVADPFKLSMISCARCARASYLTHDGKRCHEADIDLANSLRANGHMSPFEHVASPYTCWPLFNHFHGNFSSNWIQFRKTLENEDDYTKVIDRAALVEGCRGDETLADFILQYQER